MKSHLRLNIIFGVLLLAISCKKATIAAADTPIIIGHAGTALSEERAVFPPNSMNSILYGVNTLNADGVEVDVRLTKDSVLVLHHDDYYGETDFCIEDKNWNEIEAIAANDRHPIIRLIDIIDLFKQSGKLLYLDVKHYNRCQESSINYEVFNNALANALTTFTTDEKKQVVVNTRNIDLLNAIQDPFIQKSFETESVELAILYQETSGITIASFRLTALTTSIKVQLQNAGLELCVFGVKTKGEIKKTEEFLPLIIISDNIAATRRYYN